MGSALPGCSGRCSSECKFRHFSLNTTILSRDTTRFLPGRGLRLASAEGLGAFRFPGLNRDPIPPELVEPQDHEAHQRLATPPFVPHLLPEADHSVGPLHMIVGPGSLADRTV